MKKQKSKMYPSQRKYLAKNPLISCHIPAAQKEELMQLALEQNKSLSQLIQDILLKSLKEEKQHGTFTERIKNLFK